MGPSPVPGAGRRKTTVLPGEPGLAASAIMNRTCDFPEKLEPSFLIVRSLHIVTDATDVDKRFFSPPSGGGDAD
jgi:hypothetical protein